MFSVVFLILSLMVGFVLTKTCLKGMFAEGAEGGNGNYPGFMLRLPVAFTVGIVTSGILTYACCMIFATTGRAMLNGSILSMVLMTVLLVLMRKKLAFEKADLRGLVNPKSLDERFAAGFKRHAFVLCFFAVLTCFLTWFFFYSFHVNDGVIFAGYTVFSDFGPHVAIVRSFSVGENFPAQYPHFPDGSMRYHFMFHFVVGVLEFLGLRIDFAMNILSLLCLLSCLSLLYVLAVKLTKKPAAGILTIVFFLFRSSFAIFTYLFDETQYASVSEVLDKIVNVPVFIGNTPNENWGLWCNNVYANQRHLSLGISLILVAILAFLPKIFNSQSPEKSQGIATSPAEPRQNVLQASRARNDGLRKHFLASDAWLPKDYRLPVFVGILLGAATYFHGSGVVAALGILAVMAVFSRDKLEYAITAAIALPMSFLQNAYFSAGAETISPAFQYGFIVGDPTPGNIALYLIELTGIVSVVIIIGAIILHITQKRNVKEEENAGGTAPTVTSFQMLLAFSVPAVLTFTLSLTPDITVNHKFLMISIALLNIFAAYAIIWIAEFFARKKVKVIGVTIAALLTLTLTASGIVDTIVYRRNNGPDASYRYRDTSSATVEWIRENTPPHSVFASAWHVQSPIMLAGRFEFLGWPYFGWSAGYDTYERRDTIVEIFGIRDPGELVDVLREYAISYVYVDSVLMDDDEINVDVDTLNAALQLVFSDDSEGVVIYAVE